MGWPKPLELRPLMVVRGTFRDPANDLGAGSFGRRRVFFVEKGDFSFHAESGLEGEGVVVPGSGDWSVRADDGTMALDVRALLEVTRPSRSFIYVHYQGATLFDDRLVERIQLGGKLTFAQSRFITQPRLQAGQRCDMDGNTLPGPRPYGRLDTAVCVGHCELTKDTIEQHIFEVINPSSPP